MSPHKSIYRTYVVPLLTEFTSQFMVTFWGSMAMKPYGNGPEAKTDKNTTITNDARKAGDCGKDEDYLLTVFMPAFQTGISVWMMIAVFWKISGAHFNPAISIGFLVAGVLKPIMFVPYVLFQCLGSIVAAATAKIILGENPGIIAIPDGVSTWAVFLNEFICVALLIFCALATCVDPTYDQQTGLLAVGLAVFQGILSVKWVGTIGISPSRAFGPAVIVGGAAWKRHWLFWVADLSGGAFAGIYYMLLFAPPNKCWMNRIHRSPSSKHHDNHELSSMVHDDEEKHG